MKRPIVGTAYYAEEFFALSTLQFELAIVLFDYLKAASWTMVELDLSEDLLLSAPDILKESKLLAELAGETWVGGLLAFDTRLADLALLAEKLAL